MPSMLSADVSHEVSMAVHAAAVAPTKADRKRVRARLHQKLVSMLSENQVTAAMKQFQDLCKEHRDFVGSEATVQAASYIPAFSVYQAPSMTVAQEQSTRSLLQPTFAAIGMAGQTSSCNSNQNSDCSSNIAAISANDDEDACYRHRDAASTECTYTAVPQRTYLTSVFSFVPAFSMYQVPVIVVPQQPRNRLGRQSTQAFLAMDNAGVDAQCASTTDEDNRQTLNAASRNQEQLTHSIAEKGGQDTPQTPQLKHTSGSMSSSASTATDDQESLDLDSIVDSLDLSVTSPPVERTFIHFHLTSGGCRRRSLSS